MGATALAICLTLAVPTAQRDEGLLFHASYDRTLNADMAKGDGKAAVLPNSKRPARPRIVPGVLGNAVQVDCRGLRYAAKGNLDSAQGTIMFWFIAADTDRQQALFSKDSLGYDTGGHVHIQHVTTRRGVEIIRAAKSGGAPVTAEGCPHHFTLTDEAVREHDTNAKMNPPLRTEDDRAAIVEGLIDGTLDAIATDHAPHAADEKAQGMRVAPFGIIGSELCVPLTWTSLVRRGHLSDAEAVRKLTTVPASILRAPAPRLEVGGPADISVIDPDMRMEVTADNIHSKSHNTPFLGMTLTGWPVLTVCDGRETFRRRSHA